MLVDIRTVLLGLAFVVASFALALAEPATVRTTQFRRKICRRSTNQGGPPRAVGAFVKPVLTVVRERRKSKIG